MNKTRIHFSVLCLTVLAALASPRDCRAQMSTGTPVNPLEQLLLDERAGFGLSLSKSTPFHLKAHFDTFNADGKPDGSGTYEEYWDGVSRRRTDTEFRGAHRTMWSTTASDWLVGGSVTTYWLGNSMHESFYLRKLMAAFEQPIPPTATFAILDYSEKKVKLGAVELQCIVVKPKADPARKDAAPTVHGYVDEDMYCLSEETHVLRVAELYPGVAFAYNKLSRFDGREVPYSVQLSQARVMRGDFEVDTLETWKPDDAILTPPPEATTQSPIARISGGMMAGAILQKINPTYPEEAKRRHVAGQVVLAAIIDKQGTIDDLEVVSSGNLSLSQAAIDAVRQWRYKPYLLNGVPTEVETTITVNFGFGFQ
jgi:TonB family protein